MADPIPITIITGFLGAGKTTVILNLIPQLRAADPSYRVALLKNELGDVAIDSQLAAAAAPPTSTSTSASASAPAISAVRELLGGCVCCNLVGPLESALAELAGGVPRPHRIIVETSGSAWPASLVFEINRLAGVTSGRYGLDGVICVIDVENWKGYQDTSYTARSQARYTDLIVYNKWEECSDMRLDECRDRVGDLDLEMAWVKSRRGWVDKDVMIGLDGALLKAMLQTGEQQPGHEDEHDHHQSEVEVLSVELTGGGGGSGVDLDRLANKLLSVASREEVYRIKAILTASTTPQGSDGAGGVASSSATPPEDGGPGRYILNWAFGRWTYTRLEAAEDAASPPPILRMTMILARGEAGRWMKKLQNGGVIEAEGGANGEVGKLAIKRVA